MAETSTHGFRALRAWVTPSERLLSPEDDRTPEDGVAASDAVVGRVSRGERPTSDEGTASKLGESGIGRGATKPPQRASRVPHLLAVVVMAAAVWWWAEDRLDGDTPRQSTKSTVRPDEQFDEPTGSRTEGAIAECVRTARAIARARRHMAAGGGAPSPTTEARMQESVRAHFHQCETYRAELAESSLVAPASMATLVERLADSLSLVWGSGR